MSEEGDGDAISRGTWKTILATLGVAGTILFAAGQVTTEQATTRDLVKAQGLLLVEQGRALQELNLKCVRLEEKLVRLEEALRVYQAFPGQASR